MYGSNYVYLIWVNARNSAAWSSEQLPALFQVSHQTNWLLNLTKGSTKTSSKHEIVDVLKQKKRKRFARNIVSNSILNFQNVSKPVSKLTSNRPHQRSWKAVLKHLVKNSDLRIESQKSSTRRIHKSRTLKKAAPLKMLHIDIIPKKSVWMSECLYQQNFKPDLEHWTFGIFPLIFCLPILREERHLDFVQWWSPQCSLNWKVLQIFER